MDNGLQARDETPAPDREGWSAQDEADIAMAVAALEGGSFAGQVSGLVGRQIGRAGQFVPDPVLKAAHAAAAKALRYALRAALNTLPEGRKAPSRYMHVAAVAASGAVGGAFGLATLPLELPLSTTLMLRAIAAVAREEGEDLSTPESGLACLEVFALGAEGEAPHLGEGSYFATRAILARSVSEAARYLVNRSLVEESAPAVLRLIAQIASRFGVVLSQKLVAQSVPVLGAVTGAAINAAFMDHYQRLARGHFTIRRLERRHGADIVRRAYEAERSKVRKEAAPDRTRLAAHPHSAPGAP